LLSSAFSTATGAQPSASRILVAPCQIRLLLLLQPVRWFSSAFFALTHARALRTRSLRSSR